MRRFEFSMWLVFVLFLAQGFVLPAGCAADDDGGEPGDDDDDSNDTDTGDDDDSAGDDDDDDNDSAGDDDDDDASSLEDWDMYLTVDNQFDVYFGTPTGTTGEVVGGGSEWTYEYHFTAENRLHTDYLYVATASDQWVAQGFIGTFTNLTLGKTTNTGDEVWEVFPAGHYEATNPYYSDYGWPPSLMPTQEQVDIAIAYAEENDLWVTPVTRPGFDNDPSTPIEDSYTSPWESAAYNYIPPEADWIWHQSETVMDGNLPSPLYGFNHDEFLVFRVAGAVPPVI